MRVGQWFCFLIAAVLAVSSLPAVAFAEGGAPAPFLDIAQTSTEADDQSGTAAPIVVTPQPVELPDSPVIVTGYKVTGGELAFVQLYNKSSSLVSLAGWQLQVTNGATEEPTQRAITLAGYLLPHAYVVMAEQGSVEGADSQFSLKALPESLPMAAITLVPPAATYTPDMVTNPADSTVWLSLSKTSAGNYTTTSKFVEATSQALLYGGGFYVYPDTTPLRVVELLTNPRDCGPLETSDDCSAYIKLFNGASEPVDMSAYRLRVGYGNQSSGIANTFGLKGVAAPEAYVTVKARDDGVPLSLVSSGGNVWLEDARGLTTYKESVMSYQDLGATEHKGQAWALDSSGVRDVWRWATPTTTGSNDFMLPPVQQETTTAALMPCRADQYRSPETNRCRSMVSASPALATCQPGQYRSPETNRCRNLATATSALAPCAATQTRNPLTNRCKSIASAAVASLKPCAAGQERNPATNRCHAVTTASVPEAAFAVEPIADAGTAFTGWWALGGVTLLGVGYGVWEWRREVWSGLEKVGQFFASLK